MSDSIKTLLAESMDTEIFGQNSKMKLYRFNDPRFEHYLLRMRRAESPEQILRTTTSLTPPALLFKGFNASQPLLEGRNSSGNILFEIVPLQKGAPLSTFTLRPNDAYNSIFEGDDAQQRLNDFYAQAAFIGTPNPYGTQLTDDYNISNVMLDEGTLRHIDKFGSEVRKLPIRDSEYGSPRRRHHTDVHHQESHLYKLSKYMYEANCDASGFNLSEHVTMCNRARDYAQDLIDRDAFGEVYPEWKGFEKVEGIQALSLNDSPEQLLETLNTLYKEAGCER